MQIVMKNGNRLLLKDGGEDVYVNDSDIIMYTGMYHKTINDIVQTVNIETTFVGKVFC